MKRYGGVSHLRLASEDDIVFMRDVKKDETDNKKSNNSVKKTAEILSAHVIEEECGAVLSSYSLLYFALIVIKEIVAHIHRGEVYGKVADCLKTVYNIENRFASTECICDVHRLERGICSNFTESIMGFVEKVGSEYGSACDVCLRV